MGRGAQGVREGREERERERESEEATKREGMEWRDGGRMVARGFGIELIAAAKRRCRTHKSSPTAERHCNIADKNRSQAG